jgi:hypothetical protein
MKFPGLRFLRCLKPKILKNLLTRLLLCRRVRFLLYIVGMASDNSLGVSFQLNPRDCRLPLLPLLFVDELEALLCWLECSDSTVDCFWLLWLFLRVFASSCWASLSIFSGARLGLDVGFVVFCVRMRGGTAIFSRLSWLAFSWKVSVLKHRAEGILTYL